MLVAGSAFIGALSRLVWLRATRRLGLIHINLSVRGSTVRKCMVSVLARWAGVPVVVHLHSGRFQEFYRALPRWARRAVRRMFDDAARVIVPGAIWERMLVEELGVSRSNILVIPNAVAEPAVKRNRAAGEACHIVMLGRMGPPKGLPELMQALGSDRVRGLPWRITMAGDGDPETYRKDSIARGIADKVSIIGWLEAEQVGTLLSTADMLVLPSRSENLPVAVIEALSYGVAVVTTPVGAVPEIVEDGVSAVLVPVNDPVALALALESLIMDRTLRERIGQAGYAAFLARLEIGRCARTLADVYNGLLRGGCSQPQSV